MKRMLGRPVRTRQFSTGFHRELWQCCGDKALLVLRGSCRRGTQGPAAEQGSAVFGTENRKGGEFHMNPNNIRSLCHHALNDPGPKFNTHLGHSCGTVPVHLGGINIPRRNRKEKREGGKKNRKKKSSPLNIQR